MTHPLQAILDQGVEKGVFPAAACSIWRDGKPVLDLHAGTAKRDSIFDLASLTKIISTTALFMALWERAEVSPETLIRSLTTKPLAAHPTTTLADLLYHRSGLPASVPFFARILPRHPQLLRPDCPKATRLTAREECVELAAETAPIEALRTRAIYTDVGFILLGELLASRLQKPLDLAFDEFIAKPLGLQLSYRRLSSRLPVDSNIVPTQSDRPRPPPLVQEGTWTLEHRGSSPPGEVDDDNTWVMDGVGGHAGLFGTANQTARFGQAILDEVNGAHRIADAEKWRHASRLDPLIAGTPRALGFDTPSLQGSSVGDAMAAMPGVVGHLGFTGTSLWIAPSKNLVVALLTNRTALGRHNNGLKEFRPQFHEAVVQTMGIS